MLNFEIRLRARRALKNNWQIAILVGFIAMLPSMISQLVTQLTGGSILDRLMSLMETSSAEQLLNPMFLQEALTELLQSGVWIVPGVVSLAAWLVAPVLSLGLSAYLLGLLRNTSGQISSVFCRVKIWYKAIGLNLLVTLKALLWAVPGLALLVGGSYLIAALANSWNAALTWLTVLMYVGYAAAFIPFVMAMLRYVMANYTLADEPETPVRQCIARSKQLMQRRKGQLLMLEISFVGWMFLMMMLYSFASMLLGAVIGATVYMLLNLVLQIYMTASFCSFYLAASGETPVIVLPKADGPDDADPWHRS